MYRINAAGTLDPVGEMHYRFHRKIDPTIYPQVHDFYEITLVIEGSMQLTVNQIEYHLKTGTLFLIRPNDIHSRSAVDSCAYINLAFPSRVMEELFRYLELTEQKQRILSREEPPQTVLPLSEATLLKARLEKLNLLPINQPELARIELRKLIFDLMLQYFLPTALTPISLRCPPWFHELIEKLENPDVLNANLAKLAELGGCTKEHLCRSFRKYLGISPTAYLQSKRLNYAANLLLHSDTKVIDIAYACGFQSLSRFYGAFKKEFQETPMEYRRKRGIVS